MIAARNKTRAREAQLTFEALSIEGGLLSPDWLSRVTQLTAGGQAEADYRIPKGLNVRDEIGRYWRIAQAEWAERRTTQQFAALLLQDVFGFASLKEVEPIVLTERSYPIGFAALGGRVPVVIAPAGSGLDTLSPSFGEGGRRRSAFGLAQEFVNAADGAMWGLACDGVTLRILRDNASLTRPAWIEADLARIFTEKRYADFAALWLLAHETRFGRADQPVAECALETWRNAGREEGTRAREHLRRGVEDALIALGQGFLTHRENQALRAALQDGSLTTKEYFNQLLRLVYRLIFLLTVEERRLLHLDASSEPAKRLYAGGYSLKRLRERAVKRSAHDRFSDLWEATKIVFRGVASGEPRLALPALAGIFAKAQCPALDAAKLENRALLLAIFKLAWLREDGALARVNWRDMGPEELGSVYESLLELVPQITNDGRQFAFATGGETKGNARKTTGSYYTPDSLVQVLLDSALEPVVKDTVAKHPENPVEALLGLSVVDPACGSGHFLLAAARRLASHVARLQANGTPSAAEYRHALRQVVGRCIYGVDLNPMAVELCKVSLWMEAVEPGLPLTFLDSHIQHGNALLGTTPELMAKGIPDAAWEPIEGDDKKAASALKKHNKKFVSEAQRSFFGVSTDKEPAVVLRAVAELEAASDRDATALATKESQWDAILESPEYKHQKFVADAWCAAFVWPKQPGALSDAAPTNELWRQLRDGQGQPPALTTKTVSELAEQYRFFHWNLAFPQVFAKGGFDVVLGNPPWEKVELLQREWFATMRPDLQTIPAGKERETFWDELRVSEPRLYDSLIDATRIIDGERSFMRHSGRYPLCGQGRINSYAAFAETNVQILGPNGFSGSVLPPGIATDDSTKLFIQYVVKSELLKCFFAFTNRGYIFPDIESTLSFALVAYGKAKASTLKLAGQVWQVDHLKDSGRVYTLDRDTIEHINPNTLNLPVLQSSKDAVLVTAIHRRVPILVSERGDTNNGRKVVFRQGLFNMTTAKKHFRTFEELSRLGFALTGNIFSRKHACFLPLYEAKLTSQYDHRHGTFADVPHDERFGTRAQTNKPEISDLQNPGWTALPRYWVAEQETKDAIPPDWDNGWFLGFRNAISAVADARSVAFAIIPKVAVGNSMPLLFLVDAPLDAACLLANFNSFTLDYVARQKASGGNLNFYVVKQLPVLPASAFDRQYSWSGDMHLRDWILPRVLELTYTAWDLEPFARDVGYGGPPFRWDPERRFLLRCELDAAFFHLYGLNRDDTDYVMDTFPIVRKNDERAHDEYRTKRVILEIYDAMADAARTGKPYQTRLDPPPADPRVAHPPKSDVTDRRRSKDANSREPRQ